MIDALRSALHDARTPYARWAGALQPLPDRGLAHLHVRLGDSGALARIPKQSQLGHGAAEHLAYEAACFDRAAASGHTPRLLEVLAPSAALPRGALIVEAIEGRAARLPHDLDRIVAALAAIHALPLPAPPARPPLLDPADALAWLYGEVEAQAAHLDAAALAPAARSRIDAERARFAALCASNERPPKTLIAFDAHPGNFIVEASGRAVLVDLEKARYSHAPLDLAHATLYTSTTWDPQSCAVLSASQVEAACRGWLAATAGGAGGSRWIAPLRRAMWLWSATWCAKWRVLSKGAPRRGSGEDWSAALSDAALVEHVRARVDDYLSSAVVARVCDEADALELALRTAQDNASASAGST